ncbi:NAD(P)H-dependent oxidoreductase [Williamsoniiplasma somnilux]|uniref:NAD(P)H-dependent oxidoreductase n=1 Tax=Williamsoniiplasma somnilux TaxID=215578 RepID=A0A2K8NY25_9MOLU|nr:nitroreductase family protein [Williamsoniiplasma somnilux]ATZ18687.1 NAD(P)H-dependent oxidoreductase [Williamsoniiplasma somnilux]
MSKNINELMVLRSSARAFAKELIINKQDVMDLIEAARMAPTSYGLQNFKIIHLPQSEFRESLNSLFYNQLNFITASDYFLFVADSGTKILNETIEKSVGDIMGDVTSEKSLNFINNIKNSYEVRFGDNERLANEWSSKSAYIASGIVTVAAAEKDIDTCIMEGFDGKKLNELFWEKNLIQKDEFICLGMALGKIFEETKNKNHAKKIRKKLVDFYKEVK